MKQNIQKCGTITKDGIPEGEKKKKKRQGGEIFETIVNKNFPKLMTDIKPQIQRSQRTPSRISAKKAILSKLY